MINAKIFCTTLPAFKEVRMFHALPRAGEWIRLDDVSDPATRYKEFEVLRVIHPTNRRQPLDTDVPVLVVGPPCDPSPYR